MTLSDNWLASCNIICRHSSVCTVYEHVAIEKLCLGEYKAEHRLDRMQMRRPMKALQTKRASAQEIASKFKHMYITFHITGSDDRQSVD